MVTAKKLPSGSWRIRVFSHYETTQERKKKPVYESFTCKDPSRAGKRECERMASEWASSRRVRQVSETTVQEAVRKYIDLKENVLSPATIRSYETCLKSRMDDIRLYMLGGLIEYLKEPTPKTSASNRVVELPQAHRTGPPEQAFYPQIRRIMTYFVSYCMTRTALFSA